MKVNKIKPQGYCKGVILAINKCLEVLNNPNTVKPIYLLGMLIHNRFVCDELAKKGLIILDGNYRLEMLNQITNGTVIISAHGVSNLVKEKAKEKNLNLMAHVMITLSKKIYKTDCVVVEYQPEQNVKIEL